MKLKVKVKKIKGSQILIENLDNLSNYRLKELDSDKFYSLEIKEYKSQRSIEQNKMLWLLIHKISDEMLEDDMIVYCNLLERANAKYDYVIGQDNMIDSLRKSFRGVRFIRYQEVNGKTFSVFKVYVGSSKMNTAEMNVLIDCAYQVLNELGVDYEKI